MKRKFIFLVMLFALLGGVNWNVLNAQETITVGDGSYENARFPFNSYSSYNYSQQIYTAADLKNHGEGDITHIALHPSRANGYNITRNLTIYMQNTSKTGFASATDWETIDPQNEVFNGVVALPSGLEWVTIELNKKFNYTGENILLCILDNTGSSSGVYYYFKLNPTSGNGLSYASDATTLSPNNSYNGTIRNSTNYIQFTFEVNDGVTPDVPTGLVAETIDHKSVSLTWNEANNALSYIVNVYNGETLVKTVDATTNSCLVDGLNAETTYTFTVTSVRGSNNSEASEPATATTDKAPSIQEYEIGNGDTYNTFIPTYTYYNYSLTQQIYTAAELGFGAGDISKIAFFNAGDTRTRNIDIYVINTDKSSFVSQYDGVLVTENDKVYSGSVDFTGSTWTEIEFTESFKYNGGNILICVDDNTGSYKSAPNFKANTTSDTRTIYIYGDYTNYDPTSLTSYSYSASLNNQIKLTWKAPIPSVDINQSELAFGNVKVGGEYWSERTEPSFEVNVTANNTTIASISCDNDFFTFTPALSEAAGKATFNTTVSYNKEASEGIKNGNIVVTYMNGETEETESILVSATAYAPVTPDVIELKQEVEFTAGAYEDTPNFATLHDDYNLPKEVNAGSTPDAVYHFTMENEGTLTVNVTGTNAIAAVYKAEDMEDSGPMANNDYEGDVAAPAVPAGPTTFEYDFSTNGLDGLTVIDSDGDGNNWFILQGELCSESYKSGGIGALEPNNYIFTDEAYSITQNSKLLLNYLTYAGSPEYCAVVVTSDINDISKCQIVVEKTLDSPGAFTPESIDLSAFAGETVHIGLRHFNSVGNFKILINKFQLTDGSTRNRSAEPQINAVQYPAGEYYLVAAAEEAFTVSIETGALPVPGVFAYTAPADGAKEQDNPVLTWDAAQYATEYKVYLGTESTLTEESLVATVTTPSYQTEGLSNNTQYFWKVDAVNAAGTTKGVVSSFVTPLDVPQNVTAANIFEGETATVTWNAIENVTYNVYVDGTKVNVEQPITATSYELTDLAYNVSGYNVTVTANHTLGESPMSAAVNVKVGGKFTFVLNVKDTEDNAIVGATVTFNTESFLNEFYQGIPAIEAMTTDAEGSVSVVLPLPCKYGEPNYQFSSVGAIVTKEFYSENSAWVNSDTGVTNGEVLTQEVVLQLGKPAALTAEEDELLVGDDLELSWDAVTGAIGYNVYKQGEWNEETYSYDYVKLNDEMITGTEYTVEDVEYGMWVEYAVTAVYAIGESGYTTVPVSVTGMGSVSGTVTDGTNPIKGVKVVLTGKDAFNNDKTYTYTTDANGEFAGEVMVGSYTATATRYDFEDYTSNEQVVVNYNEIASVNIAMTSYPSATITVTATDAGDNAVVNWTAEYEKYNVYRRNVDTEDVVGPIATVTEETYTDVNWATLENGTYQYGVSAFVDGGNINAFEEDFQNNGWNIPDGWDNIPGYYIYNGWEYANYWSANSDYGYTDFYSPASGMSASLNTPIIDLSNSKAATLSFDYKNTPYGYGYGTNTLYIKVKADGESNWTLIDNGTISGNVQSFTKCELTLDNYTGKEIQISFELYTQAYSTTTIDNVVVSSESTIPTTITWSNELVKKSVLTLTFNNAAGDNNWNNPDNWVGGVLPTAEDNVVVNAEANITGTVAVNNLTINARLNVMPEAAFTVNGTITDANEYGNLYIEDGAQIFQKNEGVNAYFRMNIKNPNEWSEDNKDGWQFISSPLLRAEVTAAATKYDNAYQLKDYDMYKYNGSLENEWVNHKANYDFEAYFTEGRGYMYSHQARTIVTLGGELNPATTFDYEVSYNGEENPLANLHLLGNPFTFNMDWSEVTVENVYNGYATLNAAGDNYVYATSGTINVGDGFFVQAIGSEPEMSYGMRGSKEKSANINVIARGNTGEDNVIINFAGEGEGFRKLQGFNEDNARIFVENEGRRYGIANVEANATEVELSFVAAQMGNYTISLDVNGKFETVVLVDRFTGVETNMLLEDEYSFTATSNDSPNRFVVRLGGAKTESASFVYQSGDELIINAEGAIEIIDMMGRVVYSSEANVSRVNVSNFDNAAYVVRALNEGKVQKVVIY